MKSYTTSDTENHALQTTNQTLREGLREAIHAIESLQQRVKDLEGVVAFQQERSKTLEGQQAKDSHNSSLPPFADRFVRVPKSLRKQSGKPRRGLAGHEGHALHQVEPPDTILIRRVEHCVHCHSDFSVAPARLVEKRQVIDLPAKRLWTTEHQAEEKQCPRCLHLTCACIPADVSAPAQYGPAIQTAATYLVTGQVVPYAQASQLLHDLFGVQLSPTSITRFVQDCHQHLATWETHLKATLLKARVLHQDETGMRVGKDGWWVHVCATEQLTHYGAQLWAVE